MTMAHPQRWTPEIMCRCISQLFLNHFDLFIDITPVAA
jgi:hypothetical protein